MGDVVLRTSAFQRLVRMRRQRTLMLIQANVLSRARAPEAAISVIITSGTAACESEYWWASAELHASLGRSDPVLGNPMLCLTTLVVISKTAPPKRPKRRSARTDRAKAALSHRIARVQEGNERGQTGFGWIVIRPLLGTGPAACRTSTVGRVGGSVTKSLRGSGTRFYEFSGSR